MAAPGPHQVGGGGIRRRSSLVESFRWIRAEWNKYKDGNVMKGAEEEREDEELVHRSRHQSMSDEATDRRGRVETLRRRNSFSNAIKKLRKEWIGRGSEEKEGQSDNSKEVEEVEMPAFRVLRAHKQPKRRHSTGSSQRTQTVCTTPNCPCRVTKEFTARLMKADKERHCVQSNCDNGDQNTVQSGKGELAKEVSKDRVDAPVCVVEPHNNIQWDRPKLADVKRELAREKTSKQPNNTSVHRSFSDSGVDTNRLNHEQENVDSLRVLECSTSAEPHKHQSGCTNPKCACSVVKEYTRKVLAEDEDRKKKESRNTGPKVGEIQTHAAPRISPEDEKPRTVEPTPQRKVSKSVHNGCSSPDCPCMVTKIYTENLLNSDRLKRATSTTTPSTTNREPSRQRRASEPSRRAQKPPPPLDRDTFRRMAKEYNLKKQAHNTKRVVSRDAEKGSWHLNKYKTLVEISDSIPDLLQASLEDKERRREAKKDARWERNKTIRKTVQDAALSSSDYAMRRRTPVPHYHSFPKRDPPAIPALMAKLPNPPVYYRENTV